MIAADTARFAAPYGRFGLVPDYGIMWTLPARIGLGRTKMLVLSGRTIGAEQAARIGLVDELVPAGGALDTAMALAAEIAEGAPLSHEVFKAVVSRGPDSLEAVLAAEADAEGVLFATEDYVEALAAFSERREPHFRGV